MSILSYSALNSNIVGNIYNNTSNLITGDALQVVLKNMNDSLLNRTTDLNVNGGFLGISSGRVDISFIKKATPTGQFLKDDGTWATVSGGGGYTFNNGLTNTAGVVKLGGQLVSTTSILGNSQALLLGTNSDQLDSLEVNVLSSYTINSNSTAFNTSFYQEPGNVITTITNNSNSNAILQQLTSAAGLLQAYNNTGAKYSEYKVHNVAQTVANNGSNNNLIIRDEISTKGLVYAADYSANFTPESLVSKRYITGLGYISLTGLSASSPLSYNNGTGAFSIQVANTSQNGYLSSTDWNTFNGKQAVLSLTVTGSSGAATLISNTLNIPTYTLTGLGGTPSTRSITINGTSFDLSSDRSWSVGTILGSLAATSGLIPFGTGTANTIQGSSTFSYDLASFVAQPTTSFKFQVGTTTTNASIYADATGVRVGSVSNIGTALVRRFEVYGTSVPVLINSTNSNLAKIALADAGTVVGYIGATSTTLELLNSSGTTFTSFGTSASYMNSKVFHGGTTAATAYVDAAASTTAVASLRLRTGVAPTTPNDGDIWQDGTNIKIRIGGVTKTFTIV